MQKGIIFLTGFMTSGKSTIGPILANVLGWNYYDLDLEIEKDVHKKIVDIFENEGEIFFRKIETEKLKELSGMNHSVISLGGGTMADNKNVDIIKNTGLTIYLKSSPESIYKRIKYKTDRPLFKDLVLGENTKEDFLEKIKDMLIKREPYYLKSDLVIDTDRTNIGKTVDLIAKKISRILNEENKN